MNTDFTIRIAQPADVLELKDLFQDTVLNINRRDYSKAEVEDWASCGNDISHIKEMIRTHFFIVATNQQLQVVGFASITQQGYLHSMFVHKDFQGKGIATILLNEIERYATATGIIRITSEVSLTARPFFEQRGYIVTEEQKRRANQLSLTNFWMAKNIGEIFDSVYADQLQMQITVNSSSYAVKFYESLGFSKTSEEQETDGLKYTPMHYCPLRMDGLITG